uniref:hypothetical protein n=1 Tax=Clostridium sp. UBA1652 TaxID=1946348 RepID=UPI00257CD0EE
MSHDHDHSSTNTDFNKNKFTQLFLGALIFFMGIFFSKTYADNLYLFFIFAISYLILGGEVVL